MKIMVPRTALVATAITIVVWVGAVISVLPAWVHNIVGVAVVILIAAWACGRSKGQPEQGWLNAGYLLSALGDLLIGPANSLLAGMVAFMGAQAVNTKAFTLRHRRPSLGAYTVYLLLAGGYAAWVITHVSGVAMQIGVGVYALSIAVMAAQAASTVHAAPDAATKWRWRLAAIGGGLHFRIGRDTGPKYLRVPSPFCRVSGDGSLLGSAAVVWLLSTPCNRLRKMCDPPLPSWQRGFCFLTYVSQARFMATCTFPG